MKIVKNISLICEIWKSCKLTFFVILTIISNKTSLIIFALYRHFKFILRFNVLKVALSSLLSPRSKVPSEQ